MFVKIFWTEITFRILIYQLREDDVRFEWAVDRPLVTVVYQLGLYEEPNSCA